MNPLDREYLYDLVLLNARLTDKKYLTKDYKIAFEKKWNVGKHKK